MLRKYWEHFALDIHCYKTFALDNNIDVKFALDIDRYIGINIETHITMYQKSALEQDVVITILQKTDVK